MSEIKDFENDRWKEGDQAFVFRHEKAIEMISEGQKVLDIACGDGLLMSTLKKKGALVYGVDISEEAIRKCKDKGLDVSVVDIATEKLPFQDGAFDVVVMLDVLEHLYNPDVLLREAMRVSRKDLIISVPNFNSLPARFQVLFGGIPENNRSNKGHVYWFNYYVLKKMTNDAGVKFADVQLNTFWENYFLIGKLMKLITRVFPSLFALSFVVRLRKI